MKGNGLMKNIKNSWRDLRYMEKTGTKYKDTLKQGRAHKPDHTHKNFSENFRSMDYCKA
jgi:hypothetical protein